MSFSRKPQKRRGWDCFPDEFVTGLRGILGAEKFETLTLLAEKYRLFDQDLFAHPESFKDIDNELTKTKVAALLTSMGNELHKRHIVDDAESVFRIALTLRPEHSPARAMVAVICYDSGRLHEARKHAQQTITEMDGFAGLYKDILVPEHIGEPEALVLLRSLLQSIADEKPSE